MCFSFINQFFHDFLELYSNPPCFIMPRWSYYHHPCGALSFKFTKIRVNNVVAIHRLTQSGNIWHQMIPVSLILFQEWPKVIDLFVIICKHSVFKPLIQWQLTLLFELLKKFIFPHLLFNFWINRKIRIICAPPTVHLRYQTQN